MIELSANTAMMLYLSITLTVILGTWIYQHYDSKKRKIVTSEHILHVCEYCHNAYLADDFKKVTQCPQCKLFNKNKLS
jgi:uncharacterized paraquat-inducible protein A